MYKFYHISPPNATTDLIITVNLVDLGKIICKMQNMIMANEVLSQISDDISAVRGFL